MSGWDFFPFFGRGGSNASASTHASLSSLTSSSSTLSSSSSSSSSSSFSSSCLSSSISASMCAGSSSSAAASSAIGSELNRPFNNTISAAAPIFTMPASIMPASIMPASIMPASIMPASIMPASIMPASSSSIASSSSMSFSSCLFSSSSSIPSSSSSSSSSSSIPPTLSPLSAQMQRLQLVSSKHNFKKNLPVWRWVQEEFSKARRCGFTTYHAILHQLAPEQGIDAEDRIDMKLFIHVLARYMAHLTDGQEIPVEWILLGDIKECGYRYLVNLAKSMVEEHHPIPPVFRKILADENEYRSHAEMKRVSSRDNGPLRPPASTVECLLRLLHIGRLHNLSSDRKIILQEIEVAPELRKEHDKIISEILGNVVQIYYNLIGSDQGGVLNQEKLSADEFKFMNTMLDVLDKSMVPLSDKVIKSEKKFCHWDLDENVEDVDEEDEDVEEEEEEGDDKEEVEEEEENKKESKEKKSVKSDSDSDSDDDDDDDASASESDSDMEDEEEKGKKEHSHQHRKKKH